MNEQDLQDFRDIKDLIQYAKEIQKNKLDMDETEFLIKQGYTFPEEEKQLNEKRWLAQQDAISLGFEQVKLLGKKKEKGKKQKEAEDEFIFIEKEYLTDEHKKLGVFDRVKIHIQFPVYEIEGVTRGLKQKFILELTADEILKMQQKLNEYAHLVTYTDGSSLKNPGYSGAGVAFYGQAESHSSDEEEFELYENDEQKLQRLVNEVLYDNESRVHKLETNDRSR